MPIHRSRGDHDPPRMDQVEKIRADNRYQRTLVDTDHGCAFQHRHVRLRSDGGPQVIDFGTRLTRGDFLTDEALIRQEH